MFTQKEVLEMARAVGTLLGEASNARDELDSLHTALRSLLLDIDEDNKINVPVDTGCPDCTYNTVLYDQTTGRCPYHILARFAFSDRAMEP